jgi:hypothetical protein
MPTPDAAIDAILALQLTVTRGRRKSMRAAPPQMVGHRRHRRSWRQDLFKRLMPRSHAWTSFEAAREAAQRVDANARGKMAAPDAMRTPFFLGFELDERLGDRLATLKRAGVPPGDFAKDKVVAAFQGGRCHVRRSPRRAPAHRSPPGSSGNACLPSRGCPRPVAEQYPPPFYRIGG